MRYHLRAARGADLPALRHLIRESVSGLSTGFYSARQIESALEFMFGPDSQLIADGTYYVIEGEGAIVAAGGWSHRRTLFGGDQMKGSLPDPLLDPRTEPARIRAFFVHPSSARRGLGRRLFEHCLASATESGFRALELVATLPGEPLYASLGFAVVERFDVELPDGERLPVARMRRESGE
ncbi:MAG: GNAT family N-acetyltransferase [Gemmatimonadota bacterium]|nr:GNAT family N-acetyltransferase [Gemmatimonadota bacterium]